MACVGVRGSDTLSYASLDRVRETFWVEKNVINPLPLRVMTY